MLSLSGLMLSVLTRTSIPVRSDMLVSAFKRNTYYLIKSNAFSDKQATISVKQGDQIAVDNQANALIVKKNGKVEIDQDIKVLCYANK